MILKDSTPGGIKIIGGICIIFGGMMLLNGLALLQALAVNNLGPIEEVLKQLPADQQKIAHGMLKPMAIGLVIISSLLLSNVILSYSFLRQWKARQEPEQGQEENY